LVDGELPNGDLVFGVKNLVPAREALQERIDGHLRAQLRPIQVPSPRIVVEDDDRVVASEAPRENNVDQHIGGGVGAIDVDDVVGRGKSRPYLRALAGM
jgi:hypothetical protein